MNKFDKPFRILPTFDEKKVQELFNLVSNLNIHELLQYSLINQIPFDVCEQEGENLIHTVIKINNLKASQHVKLNVIKFLVQKGVNPDKPNKYNQTPLHLACRYQLDSIIKYLIELKVNVNFQDNMGLTPLHYLLSGDIKLVETQQNILDFIQTKDDNMDKKNKLIEIKKELWGLLKDIMDIQAPVTTSPTAAPAAPPSSTGSPPSLIPLRGGADIKLPIINTLSNTIENIIKEKIKKMNIKDELINLMAKQYENKNNSIKEFINSKQNEVINHVKSRFNKFADLDNLVSHTYEYDSWGLNNKDSLVKKGLIKHGNIKRKMKRELENLKDQIIILNNSFMPNDYVSDNINVNGFSEFYTVLVRNLFKFNDTGTYTVLNNNYRYNISNRNLSMKHYNAVSNASDIVDLKNKYYYNGPVLIENILYDDYKIDLNLKNNINTIIDTIWNTTISFVLSPYNNNNKLFIYMFRIFNTWDDINLYNDIIEKHKEINNEYDSYREFITYLIDSIPTASDNDKNIELFACAYVLKYYIENNDIEIEDFIKNHGFFKKWETIYNKNKPLLGIYLLDMMINIYCLHKNNDSNLICDLPLDVIILSSALNMSSKDITQNILNVYKPYLITKIIDSNGLAKSADEKKVAPILVSWIILLLSSNVTNNLLNDLISDNDDIINKIKTLNFDINLKQLALLIYYYFDNKDTFETNVNNDQELKIFYNKYKLSNINHIDTICNIIMSFYEKLGELKLSQPLLSTLLDTIYHINDIDFYSNTYNLNKDDGLNAISPLYVYNKLANSDNLQESIKLFNSKNVVNIQPSLFGLEFIKNKDELSKYLIAHTLGLKYNGSLYTLDIEQLTKITYKNDRGSLITMKLTPKNDLEYDISNDGSLQGYIPMPLNFIRVSNATKNNWNNNINAKILFNNLDNNTELRIPTIHSYLIMLLNRNSYYQNELNKILKINDDNINDTIIKLLNGEVVNLTKLYTQHYPRICNYSFIINETYSLLNEFINYYKDKDNEYFDILYDNHKDKIENQIYEHKRLAELLNKININYYLFYYLYKPENIIKLSRFNYYLLGVNKNIPYVYYADPNNTQFLNLEGGALRDISKDKSGYVGLFSYGSLNKIYEQYKLNNFNTNIKIENEAFENAKDAALPPVLDNSLSEFYNYVLIEIIKQVITKLNENKETSNLYKKLVEYSRLEINKLSIEEYESIAYIIAGKLVQELINTLIISKINNNVIKEINMLDLKLDLNQLQLNIDTININLTNTDINLENLTADNKNIKNIYSIVSKLPKQNLFIIYSNDLTNTGKFKLPYHIIVNDNIIEDLINANANAYIHNVENESSIYQLMVNYNYEPIRKLKKLGLDFRYFDKEAPIKFIHNELLNITNKILYNYNNDNKLSYIFSNINNYLFREVKNLIIANESFGNNILNNLEESFHLSTYLILQFMSQFILNLNEDYTLDDIDQLCGLLNIAKEQINDSYINIAAKSFESKIDSFNLFDSKPESYYFYEIKENANVIIVEKLLNECNIKLKELNNKIKLLDASLDNFKVDDMKETFRKINKYETIINERNAINILILNYTNYLNDKVINKVDSYHDNLDNLVKMEIWNTIFNNKVNSNYNLVPLLMLIKQKELLSNKKSINYSNELEILRKGYKQFADIASYYFENNKYTDTNFVLLEIEKILIDICKLTIGNGLELIIRRILMQYFISMYPTDSIKSISERIDMMLENESIISNNLISTLYNKTCPKLVKNAAEIYKNRNEQISFVQQSSREIILELFSLFDQFMLPNELIVVLKSNVVSYFDTISSKAILLWFVNIENIMKYFINNYRCIETFNQLAN